MPKTLEVRLNDGGQRVLVGDRVFVNLGTRAIIPDVPGLELARPLTHIEALELDYVQLGRGRRWALHILEEDGLRTSEHVDAIGFHYHSHERALHEMSSEARSQGQSRAILNDQCAG